MEIKWSQLLFQIINFGVLVIVLKKFLYQPIINLINQRNKKIEESLKAAEVTLREKAKIEEIKKQVLVESEKEAVKIVEAARKQASQTGKQLIEDSRAEAEAEVGKKLQLLTEKLAEEEKQITSRITDLVIQATTQVLKDGLSVTQQRQVINNEIKKLPKVKWKTISRWFKS